MFLLLHVHLSFQGGAEPMDNNLSHLGGPAATEEEEVWD